MTIAPDPLAIDMRVAGEHTTVTEGSC